MKDSRNMLGNAGLKGLSRSKTDKTYSNIDASAPIAVRAIMSLIRYYSSISDDSNVEILKEKLNTFLNSLATNQLNIGVDINKMNKQYLTTESNSILCTEDGSSIIL